MITPGQPKTEPFVFPVDPEKVKGIEAPIFSDLPEDLQRVLNDSLIESPPDLHGEALYDAMEDEQKAGLLNIYHKMTATELPSGRNTFSYVDSLTKVQGDRFYAKIEEDLIRDANDSDMFEVPSGLHPPPADGFVCVGSLKTDDDHGNLQLTFFAKPPEFMVDADIDNSAGIQHSFDVIEHTITNTETHPYDIHEILVHHQDLDPGYRLLV